MQENLLSIQEAARVLGVSTKTLRRWEARGILVPQRTTGAHRRYTLEQIQKFQNKGEETPLATEELSVELPSEVAENTSPKKFSFNTSLLTSKVQDFKGAFKLSGKQKVVLVSSLSAFAFVVAFAGIVFAFAPFYKTKVLGLDAQIASTSKIGAKTPEEVLAATIASPSFRLRFNADALFSQTIRVQGVSSLVGGIVTENADIDAGTGELTASNVIYSIIAGQGISITPGQNPVISATSTGTTYTAGSGISISSDNVISNTSQGANGFGKINVGGDTISAGSPNSTFSLAAGSGISLAANSGSSTITISSSGGVTSPWEDNGLGVVSLVNLANNVTIGNTSDIFRLTVEGDIGPSQGGTYNLGSLSEGFNGIYGQTFFANGSQGITQGTASCVTTVGGIVVGTGTCQLGSEQWVVNNGIIYTGIPTLDFALGGTSTASAKFAVLNMAAGTPVASISAGTTGNATSLSGNGVLSTTNGQTLTLGNSTTGNIELGNSSFGASTGNNAILYAVTGTGQIASATTNSTGLCLLSTGSTPTWGSCGSGTTSSPFGELNGAIVPLNSTEDLLVGGQSTASAKFAFINVSNGTPTASISGSTTGNSLYITGDGNIATTNMQTLTIGSATTGNVSVFGLGTGVVHSTNGTLSTGLVTNAELQNSSITVNTGTGISVTGSPVSLGGAITINNTGVTSNIAGTGISIDQSTGAVTITNTGVTSLSGTPNQVNVSGATGAVTLSLPQNIDTGATPTFAGLTLSGLTNAGGVLYTNGSGVISQTSTGTATQCLVGGTTPTWASCGTGTTNSPFEELNGAIVPLNTTEDLLVGGQSSASAKFAFINVNSGVPTASISAGTTGNNAYLSGNGVLATTNKQTLTIGSSTTGNIAVNGFSAGVVQSDANGFLSSSALNLAAGSSYITGILPAENGGTGLNTAGATNGQLLIGNGSGFSLNTLSTGTGISVTNGSGTITINNTGVTSNIAGNGISVDQATGAVTITNTGVLSIQGGTSGAAIAGALTLANSTTAGSTITIDNAAADGTTKGIAAFNSTNFSASSGVINTIQDIDITATPEFTGLTLSGFTNNGGVLYTNGSGVLAQTSTGTAAQCLVGGATPTWASCSTGGTDSPFTVLNGAIVPLNSTEDFLVGGQSTASAKFAFLNTNSGTPTASISAGTTGNNLYITGDGSIATTNKQTLTLGSSSTGNVSVFGLGTGVVHSTNGTLSTGLVTNAELQNSSITVNGGTGLGVSGSPVALGGILTLSNTGVTSATAGTGISIDQSTGGITISNTGVLSIAGGTGGSAISGALTLANSTTAGSAITIDNAAADGTTKGIAAFNATNFSASSGVINTIQNINTAAAPTFGGLTLSNLTNAGGVVYTNGSGVLSQTATGTATQCLVGGATPTWASCSSGGTDSPFTVIAGAIVPLNSTEDLLVGGQSTASAKFAFINANSGIPTASISAGTTGNNLYITGDGNLATTNKQTLTLGSSSTGNIVAFGIGTGVVHATNGALSTGVVTNAELQNSSITVNAGAGIGVSGSPVALGGAVTITNNGVTSITGATGGSSALTGAITFNNALTSAGAVTIDNAAADGTTKGIAAFNSTNFSASSGVINTIQNINTAATPTFAGLTLSGFSNAGGVLYTNGSGLIAQTTTGTAAQCLIGGSTPTWASCGTGTTASPFQELNGSIVPLNSTEDLLVGGQTTASAKFAFINVNSGVPTASIAGNLYITGNGSIATTNKQTLTLGSASTGNIAINGFGSGVVQSDANGYLSSAALNLAAGSSYITGILPVANGGTGVNGSSAANGSLLIGNGTGYSLATLTAGNGISITNGAGSITIANSQINQDAFWNQNNGLLYPNNSTVDFAVGGQSTQSAKFAITGVNTGAPVATLSASTNNNGLSLNAATSTIQSLINSTLSIGGNTTGNITVSPLGGAGNLGLNIGSLSVNGEVGVTVGTAACVTTVNGIVVGTGTCQLGSEQWVVNNGLIYTGIPSLDFALGGTSTASAKFAVTNINTGTPTATISAGTTGNASYLSGDGILATTNKQTLTLGSSSTGNIAINGFTAGVVQSNAQGVLSSSALNLAGGASYITGILPAANGGTGVNASTASNGQLLIGNGSGLSLANLTAGNGISITNGAGSITIASTQGNQDAFWNQNAGLLFPNNSTVDLTIGGQSTASAKFAFVNVNGGVPTASISAGTTGNNLYITGDGNISTTNKQTLTLGSANSGNLVAFGIGTGVVHATNGALSTGVVTNAELQNSSITVNGGTGLGVSGSPVALGGILTLSNTGVTSITGATGGSSALTGAITFNNALTSAGAITIDNAAADGTTKGIAAFNATNFSAVSGVINTIQNINTAATPTFAGLTLSGFTNNGGIVYANGSGVLAQTTAGTASQCLIGGTTPTWGTCSTGTTTSPFTEINGAIVPLNQTEDLLVGGVSSAAAKFAFINVNSGIPTASIAGSTTGTNLYVNGNGNVATTNMQSLTLGSSTTGKIVLNNTGFGSSTGNNAVLYATSGTGALAAVTTNSTGLCLTSGASGPSWVSCSSAASNYFDQQNGALYPTSSSVDFLVGGQASSSAKFAVLNVNSGVPTASISAGTTGNNTFLTGAGNLGTTNFQTLTLGGATTGNIVLSPKAGAGTIQFTNFTNAGGVLFTNGSGILSQTGTGTSAQCLIGGTTPTWGTCSTGTTNSPFEELNGAIVPLNSTEDLLVGGQSSASAKFAFINVAGGTPTASISAGTTGNNLYITGNGTLATTNKQTLTLGSASTGNIAVNGFGAGVVQSSTNGFLSSAALNLAGGASYITGILPVANGGTGVNGSSAANGSLLIGNGTGYSLATLTAGNGITITNGAGSITIASNQGNQDAFWNQNAGVLFPNNSTVDVTFGGQSTASAKFAFLNTNSGTPTASISAGTTGNNTFLTGAGVLSTTNKQTLTLGSALTGNIVAFGIGTGVVHSTNGTLSTGLVTNAELQNNSITVNGGTGLGVSGSPVALGGTLTLSNTGVTSNIAGNGISVDQATGAVTITNTGVLSIQGGTSGAAIAGDLTLANSTTAGSTITIDNAAADGTTKGIAAFNSTNFQAASGVINTIQNINTAATPTFAGLTLSGFTNAGGVLYTNGSGVLAQTSTGTAAQCLVGGATPTWASCSTGTTTSPFTELNGAIVPLNSTEDFLVGGQSSASAKFAVLNVNSGVPTASISAGTTGNNVYLTGSGILATTNKQTLTLGSSSTGNIAVNGFAAGVVQSNAQGVLSSSALNLAGGASYITGILPVANGGTGVNGSSAANGSLLIGNGSGYTLATLTQGTGITITNGVGSITIANAGVLSIAGGTGGSAISGALTLNNSTTAGSAITIDNAAADGTTKGIAAFNSTNFSASSGVINTIQNINTAATPTFAGLTLSGFSNAGGVLYTNGSGVLDQTISGTNTQCLVGGTTPTWADCSSAANNYWNLANGALFPINNTTDFLIGGSSTSSAKFAILNVNGTGPATATVSGNLIVMPANGAGGNVGIGTTTPTAKLDISASYSTVGYPLRVQNNGYYNAYFQGTNANNQASFYMENNRGSFASYGGFLYGGSTSGLGNLFGVSRADKLFMFADGASNLGMYVGTLTSQPFVVGTNNIERLRVTGAGNVGIGGDTTPDALFSVGSTSQFQVNSSGEIAAATGITSSGTITFSGLTGTNGVIYGTTGTGVLAQATTSTTGLCLVSGASAPSWSSCPGSASVSSPFTSFNGAIVPLNQTEDLLVGGVSSAAAKFAFINVNSGVPTASISAGTTGNNTFLTGDGTLSTTNKQTLTLGSASTGNVSVFGLGTGVVHSTGGTLSVGPVTNAELQNSSITVNGGTGLGVSGSPVALGGTITLSNTGVTSNIAGTGISVDQSTGAVTITNTGVLSIAGGTGGSAIAGALTLANSTTAGSTITIDNAAADGTTKGIASFNATNFQASSGVINTIQDIDITATPEFTGLTLSGFSNAGGVLFTDGSGVLSQTGSGTNTQCLVGGTTPTWADCSSAANNYWTLANGALFPTNNTTDFFIGGSSTSSAKFAILNVNGTGPATATVSGNLIVMPANGAGGKVGIGTINPTTELQISDTTGDAEAKINLAATTGRLQLNGNNILSASSTVTTFGVNGTERMRLDNNGNLGINTTAPTAKLDVNGTASISGQLALYGTPTIQSTALQTLTLGGNTTGNILINPTGDVQFFSNANRISSSGNLTLAGTIMAATSGTINGININSGAVSGVTTLNASGGITFSTFTTNGGVLYTNGSGVLAQTSTGTAAQCLVGGATPTWAACPGSTNISSPFTTNAGAIVPINQTMDLLVGGVSSAAAKFAFINVNNGVPTASISAGTTGNNTFLTGAGNLGTTNRQTLTLGGSTTGNIVLSGFGAGIVHSNASGVLSSSALNLAGGATEVTGTLPVANGGTGQTTYTNGQLLIGNTTGNTLTKATLTAGNGITITNGSGSITIASNQGNQDAFWNQASGALFTNNSTVDLLVGGQSTASAKFAVLNVNSGVPTASISAGTTGNNTYLSGSGILATTNKQTLTLGSSSTGNIAVNGFTAGVVQSSTNGFLSSAALNLAGGASYITGILPVANGGTGVNGSSAGNGTLLIGNGTGYSLATLTAGNGVTITNGAGSITIASNQGNQDAFWNQNAGLLFPNNSTVDVTFGGQSTASAKFAFLNVNNGTPTASIAGTTTGTNTYLTGNGVLGTTNKQTLTLGSSSTGNIAINGFTAGVVQSNAQGVLSSSALNLAGGASYITGILPAANGGTGVNGSSAANGSLLIGNGTGYSLATLTQGTGVTITNGAGSITVANAGVLSIAGGTGGSAISGALTLNNSTTAGSTITIDNAAADGTTKGIAAFNSTNFSAASGVINTIQNINTAATPTFGGLTLSNLTGNNAVVYGTAGSGLLASATTSTTGLCLTSGASNPTWAACQSGSQDAFWNQANGALFANNSTVDLLVGGQSTASAKFAVTGVNSNAPVATLSGSTGGSYLSAAGTLATTNKQTLNIGAATTGDINIGTDATERNISIGNSTGATALNFTSGTGTQTFTSGATTGTAFSFAGNSVTSGTGLLLSGNALTGGSLASLSSTSTALTGTTGIGSLLSLDWSPGSATTATGDLLSLNIGSNGTTTGNLFNILDSGSSLFAVSETAVTSNLPASFNAAGDTSFAYDIQFTNPTASFIKSNAPLTIAAGKPYNSSNLTLSTYNVGNVIVDSQAFVTNYAATISGQLVAGTLTAPANIGEAYITNSSVFGKALAILNQTESQDILTGSSSGTTVFRLDNSGNLKVAAGTTLDTLSAGTLGIGTTNATTLTLGRSGQGITLPGFTTNNNTVLTTNGSGVLSQVTTSTAGQCLTSQAAGNAPVWGSCGASGTNWWTTSADGKALTPINSTMDLLVGGTSTSAAKFAVLGVNGTSPTASVSAQNANANAIYLDAANVALQSVKRQTLTLGGSTTGNITLAPIAQVNITGDLKLTDGADRNILGPIANELNIRSGGTSNLDLNDATGGNVRLFVDNSTASSQELDVYDNATSSNDYLKIYHTGTAAVLDTSSNADSLTLQPGGGAITLPSFVAKNSVLFATETTGVLAAATTNTASQCLLSGASGPSWGTCAGGTNYWNQANGALFTANQTADVLFGSTATSSAKFAFINVNSGTPTASISGSVAGVNTYLSGDGVLSTTLNRSLAINPSGGNVGIGVAAPEAALDIQGTTSTAIRLRSSNNPTQTIGDIYMTAFGGLVLSTRNTTATQGFVAIDAENSSYGMLLYDSNTGTTDFSNFYMNNDTTDYLNIVVNAANSTTGLVIQDGGNVGVGDTTPNSLFSVGSTSQFQVNSSGAIAAATGITSSGNITFSTFTTNGGLLYTNGSGVLSQITSQGSSGDCLLSAGAGAAPAFGTCPGAGSVNYWNQANGALFTANQTADVLFGSTSSSSAKFAFLNVNNGTPTASISAGTTGNNAFINGAGQIGTTNRQTLTIGSASGFDTTGNILIAPNGNGNVGIGRTSALAKLDISGGSVTGARITNASDGVFGLVLNNATFGSTDATGFGFVQGNSGIAHVYNNNIDSIKISASGNVGVGPSVLDPAYPLDVTGRARITGTSGLVGNIGDNTYALSLQNNASSTWLEILNNGGAGKGAFFGMSTNNFEQYNWQGGDITFFTNPNASTGTERLRITNNGLVGIGTGSPTSELHVNRASTQPALGKALVTFDQNENQDIFTASASGSTKFTITNSGQLQLLGNLSPDITSTGNNSITVAPAGSGEIFLKGDADSNIRLMSSAAPTNSIVQVYNSGQATSSDDVDGLWVDLWTTGSTASQDNAGINVGFSSANTGTGSTLTGLNIRNLSSHSSNVVATGVSVGTGYDYAGLFQGKLGVGTTTPASQLYVTRPLSYTATGKSLTILDQIENQDIFSASKSGTTRFIIGQNGEIGLGLLAGVQNFGNSGDCLKSGGTGSTATWGTCGGGGTNYWQLNNGLVSPFSDNAAFAIGGTSTSSAWFSVDATQVAANVPVSFNAPGDVSVAYDLQFTNPTASYIKSAAPLALVSGEIFNSSNLTLSTYNSGNVVVDSQALTVMGSATVSGQFAVGPNGTTNPAFFVDSSAASSATGIQITSAAAGGGVTLAAISSGTNEALTINSKGTGTITIDTPTAGTITIGAVATTLNLGTSNTATTVNLGTGTGGNTINIGTGATTGKTINIGTGNVASTINLGTGNAATNVMFFPRTANPNSLNTNGEFHIGSLANSTTGGRIWFRSSNVNFRFQSATNALDYSEYLKQEDTSEPGDVMVLSNSETQSVKRSDKTYDQNVLGVVSQYGTGNADGCVDDPSCGRSYDPHYTQVGMLGQVYTKVSTENGNIKPGDPLTTSSVQGVAMKATKMGRIVGYALDYFDGTQSGEDLFDLPTYPIHVIQGRNVGKIIILLQAGWYDPSAPPPDGIGDIAVNSNGGGDYGLVDSNGHVYDNTIVADQAAVANIKVGQLLAQEISAESLHINSDVTINGTLYADKIKANQIEGLEYFVTTLNGRDVLGNASNSASLEQFATLDNKIASISGSLTGIENLLSQVNFIEFATQSGTLVTADNLMVPGTTTLAEASILNSLSIGNNLTIDGSSVNTTGTDLEIQSLAQGAVNFFGGLVRFDTDGSISVAGDATFAKDVVVEGVLSAKDIAVGRVEASEIISDTEVTATGSSGLVTLKAGETQLKVNNTKVKTGSLIFLTPKVESDLPIYVKQQANGYFIIGIKEDQLVNIPVNFLIVN